MKKRLFNYVRQDTCIFCNTDRSIELYDKNDNPIRYSFILDNDRYNLLDIREIHYGKCNNCGRRFLLDWRNGKYPTPLLDNNIQIYMQQYNKSKIV